MWQLCLGTKSEPRRDGNKAKVTSPISAKTGTPGNCSRVQLQTGGLEGTWRNWPAAACCAEGLRPGQQPVKGFGAVKLGGDVDKV